MPKYKLTIEIYGKPKASYTKTCDSFEEGISKARFASELLTSINVLRSRHPSCENVVAHMDTYFDLYNEGAIQLEKCID